MSFATENGAWTIEEAPLRWINGHARGIAAAGDVLYALVWHPDATRLWTLREDVWTQEPVLGFQVAPHRLFGNGTHIFIVGVASDGSLIVQSRPAVASAFERHTLVPAQGLVGGLWLEVAAYAGGPPAIVFQHDGFPQNPASTTNRMTQVARSDGTGWSVDPVLKSDYEVGGIGTSRDATFFAQSQEFGSTIWRKTGERWTPCDLPNANELWKPAFLSYADQVWLVTKEPFGTLVRAQAMDPAAPTCIAEEAV